MRSANLLTKKFDRHQAGGPRRPNASSRTTSASLANPTSSRKPRLAIFLKTRRSALGLTQQSLARQLGASLYIDSQAQDPSAELQRLGGARVILATATSGDAMSAVQGGLAVNGTLSIIGAGESMQVTPMFLIMGCRSIKGWYSGTSIDSQDALSFSSHTGVRPMNEIYPLERVSEGYDRMMSGKARFRVVLSIEQ